jgi:hypothetical protein
MRRSSMFDSPMAVSAVALASQEGLGDLRLYRLPFATTVAGEGQKQVGFLSRRNIRGRRIYAAQAPNCDEETAFSIMARMRNREADGLGEPLPMGQVAFYGGSGDQPLLLGGDRVRDLAVGEEFELALSITHQVFIACAEDEIEVEGGRDRRRATLTVTNANPHAVPVEVALGEFEDWVVDRRRTGNITIRRGESNWIARVPANGRAELVLVEPPDGDTRDPIQRPILADED